MPANDAEIIRYLFGLPQSQIDADLTAADADDLLDELLAFQKVPPAEQTPDRVALNYHKRLLQASAFQKNPEVPEDARFYLAAITATNLADEVATAAFQNERLAELTREMKKIEEREGLKPGEFWKIGEGPEDYGVLTDESDRLHAEFTDSIFLEALRRYHFDEVAKTFQEDRVMYEVRFEVGRRQTMMTEESGEYSVLLEERLLNEYGRRAYDLLQERLRAAGLSDE
jgi:hypothetical protein